MSVKRYEVNGPSSVFEDKDGSLVDYKDYAALEQRLIESERYGRQTDITIDNLEMKLAQVAAENAGLKSAIEKHADSYIMCGYCRTERDGKNDDVCEVLDSIPATDAFLTEVRAQGVEMFAKEMHADISGDDAREFAAQLRKGVQS